ncbi:MAG: hypothetical protein AB7S98_25585 [Burkholderiaceae bacterium]
MSTIDLERSQRLAQAADHLLIRASAANTMLADIVTTAESVDARIVGLEEVQQVFEMLSIALEQFVKQSDRGQVELLQPVS